MRRWVNPVREYLADRRSWQALAVLLIFVPAFIGLAVAIRQPGLQEFDLDVTLAVQRLGTGPLNSAMAFFTFMGDSPTLFAVALFALAYLWSRGLRVAGVLCLASLVGLPLNMLLKGIIGRPRPDAELVEVAARTSGLSFPSGHAMASTILYGLLAVLSWMHVHSPSRRLIATIGFGTTAILISVSRVYLGAHWFSDIVGGWAAGLVVLVLFVEGYRLFGIEGPEEEPTTVDAPLG